ncbi:hypothetical protein EBU91_03725 [bacterium]|jgi:ribosomal protein L12E/L44/L45/RPP1/RPP2|nr:hypothetical protein [bacterium]
MIAQLVKIQILSAVIVTAALAFGVHMENQEQKEQEQKEEKQEEKQEENVVWLSGTIRLQKVKP